MAVFGEEVDSSFVVCIGSHLGPFVTKRHSPVLTHWLLHGFAFFRVPPRPSASLRVLCALCVKAVAVAFAFAVLK
jgi:hypothetical protein